MLVLVLFGWFVNQNDLVIPVYAFVVMYQIIIVDQNDLNDF